MQPPAQTGPPTSQYHYVLVPTPAAPAVPGPRILEIAVSDRNVTAPGPVAARIKTTNDVVSVDIRSMGRTFSVPHQGPGLFEGTNRLPSIPFFLKGRTYTIDFVATDDQGRTATQSISVYLNR